MEHDPGPRGSPHMPQAPAAPVGPDEREGEAAVVTANADSCFSSSALAQRGQLGDCPSRVRYSKWWPQPRHAYSNRGMRYILQLASFHVHGSAGRGPWSEATGGQYRGGARGCLLLRVGL